MAKGTIYGAANGPGTPSVAAMYVWSRGLPMARKIAVDGLVGPILGGTSVT